MKLNDLLVEVWHNNERFMVESDYFSNFNYESSKTRLGKSKIIFDFGRFN